MFKTKTNWLKRGMAMLMAVVMAFSVNVASVSAAEENTEAKLEQCPTPEVYLKGLSVDGYWISNVDVGVGVNEYDGTRVSGYTYYYTLDGTEPTPDADETYTGKTYKTSSPRIQSNSFDENGVCTFKILARKDGYADSDVAIFVVKKTPEGQVAFQDANFKKIICKELGKEEDIMTVITEEDMTSLTKIVAENAGITNVTGIKYATNIETLDLSGNPFDSLNSLQAAMQDMTDFNDFTKLKTIDLSNCGLTDAEIGLFTTTLAKTQNLESVDLSDNEIVSYIQLSCFGHGDLAKLKVLDLSGNKIAGVYLPTRYAYESLEKFDLSDNYVYASENDSIGCYESYVDLGIEKFDLSNQKPLTDLAGAWVSGVDSNAFNSSYIDNENKIVDLGNVMEDTITFKLQGYIYGTQTMSAIVDDADMPVLIADLSTSAKAEDTCMIIKELNPGENTFKVALTHISGQTATYTVKVNYLTMPVSDDENSAGIKDPVIQKYICGRINSLAEYKSNPVDPATHVITKEEMAKITGNVVISGVSDTSGLEYLSGISLLSIIGDYTNNIDVSRLTNLQELTLEGNFTQITGLDALVNLEKIDLDGNFTSLTGLENKADTLGCIMLEGDFTDVAALNLPTEYKDLYRLGIMGDFETAPDLSAFTTENSYIWIDAYVAEDGTIPKLGEQLSGLVKTLRLYNYSNNIVWPTNWTNLGGVYVSGVSGTFTVPQIKDATATKNVGWNIAGNEGDNLVLDISKSNGLSYKNNIILNDTNCIGDKRFAHVVLKGSGDSIGNIKVARCGSVEFADDFSAANASSLAIQYMDQAVTLPKAEAIPAIKTLTIGTDFVNQEEAFTDTINKLRQLETVKISNSTTNLDAMDLSQTSVKKLTFTLPQVEGMLDGSKLPATITEISMTSGLLEGLSGDWSHMTGLTKLDLSSNRIGQFPSEVIKQLTELKTLNLGYNRYSSIPEDTFENSANLTSVTIGNYIPVVAVSETSWDIDPNSETGKAIAKLKEVSPNAFVSNIITQTGSYATLVGLKSSVGSITGDPFNADNRNLELYVPAGTENFTLTADTLLDDTVITVNGVEYKNGEEIPITLQESTTVLKITCYNEATNSYRINKEVVYTLTISNGEVIENFVPEEGKTYSIASNLLKGDGSTSMADQFFQHNVRVKMVEEGKYEIILTCNMPTWINDMLYGDEGTHADVVGGDMQTKAEYRIYTNDLENRIAITPNVVPMGNVYTTCYLSLNLEKVMDISSSVGADKADLNAAINNAVAITEKRNVYTEDSYSAMLAEIEEAQRIAELAAPLQSVVDSATAELNAAIEALVVDESKLANKTDLNTVITEAKAIEKGNHTDTAWNVLQEAIADAQVVYDTLEASQSEVDSATKALNTAVTLFNNSGAASTLDKNNLEDGVYSVYVDMIKMDRESKSMADNAINHTVKLEVIDGEYFITLDFSGITIENRFGYLKNLSYYLDGYTYGEYGTVTGTIADATVLSTQKDSEGNDVIDQYNDANTLYPDLVKIKLVPQAIADENGYVPLHVFVPIMEAIAEGNGDQDVLMKIDWSTLKATTSDDEAFQPGDADDAQLSPAVDVTDSKTGVKVHADKGVFEEGVELKVTEITSGTEYDKAVKALEEVGKKFKLYEVHFVDEDGSEVQPNGTVTVYYKIPAGYDKDNLALYRINEDGSKTLIKGVVEGDYYKVITKSFSTYALVEKNSTITDVENTTNVNNGNTQIPQTGDNFNPMLWFAIMLASAGMIVVGLTKKHKLIKGE